MAAVSRRFLALPVLLALAVGLALFATRAWMHRAAEWEVRAGEIADFADLPAGDASRFLACPPDYCNLRPDATVPVFDLPWEDLRDRWSAVVAVQPRLRLVAGDGDLTRITYIQASPLLGLPDLVTVQFVPLDEHRSSLAILSRSRYPLPDLGANAARVNAWLAALRKSVSGG